MKQEIVTNEVIAVFGRARKSLRIGEIFERVEAKLPSAKRHQVFTAINTLRATKTIELDHGCKSINDRLGAIAKVATGGRLTRDEEAKFRLI